MNDLQDAVTLAGELERSMDIDQFLNIVRRLSNQTWVRWYAHREPEHLVLEVAEPRGHSDHRQLDSDLAGYGFQKMTSEGHRNWVLHCWKIRRAGTPTTHKADCE